MYAGSGAGSKPVTMTQLKIIGSAMMAGVIAFACVAIPIGSGAEDEEGLGTIFLLVLALMGITELPVYIVLRMAMLGRVRDRAKNADDPGQTLWPVYQQLFIIGSAMAEGFGLAGIVFFLVTGLWPLLIAAIISLVVLGLRFPTEDKFAGLVSSVTGRLYTLR